MVLGFVGDMVGEVVYQTALGVSTIADALFVGIVGEPVKPLDKPKKPSPRTATPSPSTVEVMEQRGLGGLGGLGKAQQGPMMIGTSPQQPQQPQQPQDVVVERQSSATSFFSLPPQPASGQARGAAMPPSVPLDSKMVGAKATQGEEGLFEGREQRGGLVSEEEEERSRLHHPALHYPTAEGEGEGMGMGAAMLPPAGLGLGQGQERFMQEEEGEAMMYPKAARRSSSMKQVKCNVM